MRIIGIDCATDPGKVGLALGEFRNGCCKLIEAALGSKQRSIVDHVVSWVDGKPVLLALDAPLGWPALLGENLRRHNAGDFLPGDPNKLFRRETDRMVKVLLGKQPLDVGADRIARTATSALRLLDDIRMRTSQAVPLAWPPHLTESISAIEVYPAGTLVAHGVPDKGYKKKEDTEARRVIIRSLDRHMELPSDVSLLESNADTLDAAICVLAGADFLRGNVFQPEDAEAAKKEGWIWVWDSRSN